MKRRTKAVILTTTAALLLIALIVGWRRYGDGLERKPADELKQSSVVGTWTSGKTTVTLDDHGTLWIRGNGSMKRGQSRSTGYKQYSRFELSPWCIGSGVTNAVIDDGVTVIGDEAFSECADLISVTIPSSVRYIPTLLGRTLEHVFEGCTSLTSVNVNKANPIYRSVDGVLFLKSETEKGNLELILYPRGRQGAYKIPKKVTYMYADVFSGCAGLTELTVPRGFEFNGRREGPFAGSVSLTSINVNKDHQSYSSIDGVLFDKKGKKLLLYPPGRRGSYTVPDAVDTILIDAFKGCAGLTSVNIPGSVVAVSGDGTFDGCINLASINVGKDNPSYSSVDGVLFDKEGKTLLRYPPGKHGAYNIPNTVREVYYGAFEACIRLPSVTVPESVTDIDGAAFDQALGLISITMLSPDPPAVDMGYALARSKFFNGVCLYVPKNSVKKYRDSEWGKTFKCVKPIAAAGNS